MYIQTVFTPDFYSKKSTLRRSSILRDLKRIKNNDHRKGGAQRFVGDECDCMTQLEVLDGIGLMTIMNSNIGNGETNRGPVQSENAFMERIIGEQ
ncbi:hypothetical protein ANCDUO_24238, partial [Ancylostoma duodenale]